MHLFRNKRTPGYQPSFWFRRRRVTLPVCSSTNFCQTRIYQPLSTIVPAEISETLHLQQIVNIPKLSEKKAESSRSSGATQKFVERPWKPARPQPEGLRMRYKPYGYSGDMEGAIGFDDGALTAASKRKHGDTTDATALKKSKKDKKHKEKSRQDDGEAGEPMEGVEATAAAEKSEKKKKKKKKDKKDKEGRKEKKEKKRKE